MKSKKTELVVDYIGGEGSLTLEEEQALHAFFQEKKLNAQKKVKKRIISSKKSIKHL
jgi:hypothetical protein